MAQQSGSIPNGDNSSAVEREADHVDDLMNGGPDGEASKKAKEGAHGLNSSAQVEQDSRIEKAQADAKTSGGGPDRPEDGLNQDG